MNLPALWTLSRSCSFIDVDETTSKRALSRLLRVGAPGTKYLFVLFMIRGPTNNNIYNVLNTL